MQTFESLWLPRRGTTLLESLESRVLLTSPTGSNPAVEYLTRQALDVTFDVDVSGSLAKSDLQVQNITLTPDDLLDGSRISLSYPGGNNATAVFQFVNGLLTDGNYRGALSREDVSNNGDPMASDVIWDSGTPQNFFVLGGDANHDRTVDVTDLGALATNWQMAGDYSQGDFNYDGFVDVTDLGILATNWQKLLQSPPSGPNEVTVNEPVTGGGLVLNWVDGVTDEIGWRVQRSTNGQTFDWYTNLAANTNSWTHHAVFDGRRYWYRVRAYGNGVDTAYTPKRAATTVLAAPFDVIALAASPTAVDLTWRSPSRGAAQFSVLRSTNPTSGFTSVGTPAVSHFRDTTVAAGQTYYYRVVAQYAPLNLESAYTSTQAVATPVASSISTLTGTATDSEHASFSWTPATGATEYWIEGSFDGSDFGDVELTRRPSSVTSVDFEELDSDSPLYLRVKAYNGGTLIGTSNVASATADRPAPDVPGFVKAIESGTNVHVSWMADDYAEYFLVQRNIDGGGFVDRIVIPGTTYSFTDDDIPAGETTVSYQVKAVNTAGESAYSDTAIAGPPMAPPQPEDVPQRSFLLAFYGAEVGSPDGEANRRWLRGAVQQRAAQQYGYETLNPNPGSGNGQPGDPYRDFKGPTALRDLLAAIDFNGNFEISQAEIDAVHVRMVGWSLGAVEAVTVSRMLHDTTGFVGSFAFRTRYHLDAPIPVDDLVMIGPVSDGPAPLFTLRIMRPALDNVQNLVEYYQRRGGTSALDYYLYGTYQSFFPIYLDTEVYGRSEVLGFDLLGQPVRTIGIPEEHKHIMRVDQMGLTEAVHDWIRPNDADDADPFDGVMTANQVNHHTIVWWVQELAVNELG